MLRSPISPASFCTSVRSSSRNAISSGESGAACETFLPGILTPNHQSNAKTAATAMLMRRTLKRIRQSTHNGRDGSPSRPSAPARPRRGEQAVVAPYQIMLPDFLAEAHRAKGKQGGAHAGQD